MHSRMVVTQVVLTFLHCFAVTSALFRFHRRKTTGQLGWDDYVAAIALVLNLIYFPTLWFPGGEDLLFLDPATHPKEVTLGIVHSWLLNLVWNMLLWMTRISLGLSIIRVLPKSTWFNRASWVLVGVLIAAAVAVLVISAVKCATTYSTWSTIRPYQCDAGAGAFVAFTIMDVVSDLLLVAVPLRALWREAKLTSTTRLIIKIGFAANILTAISSLVTGIIFLTNCTQDQFLVALRISTHIMCVISILACNSLVVVTSLYRHLRNKTDVPERQFLTPHPLQSLVPVTVQAYDTSRPTMAQTREATNIHITSPGSSVVYTDDKSACIKAQDSLRLTLTIIETDPSLISSAEGSCSTDLRRPCKKEA